MCRCDGYTRCTEYSLPFRRDLFVSVIMLGIYRPEFALWNFILAKKILCMVFFHNNDRRNVKLKTHQIFFAVARGGGLGAAGGID